MIGRTISHYQIVSVLGAGGMGVVYRATDTRLGRSVALKFLNEKLSRDHQAVLRFEQEARAASALNDPGICTVYEIGDADGQVFIAMELLEGQTLHERIARGPIPFAEAIEWALHVVNALQAAHVKRILHRDIKPANIFLVGGRRAKILDFGLAKIGEIPGAGDDAQTVARPIVSQPGHVMGTQAYMSPEQALGQPVDARSDLFSFGVVLYEMTTGQRAFAGSTAAVYDGILNRTPARPSEIKAHLPGAFDVIVEKALRKDPEGRYQTAAEMHADLKRLTVPEVAAGVPPSMVANARTTSALVAGIGVATFAAAAVATYLWTSRGGATPTRPFLADATFAQVTERPGLEASPSLSPDGRSIVYASTAAGNWDIYLQTVGGDAAINLTPGVEANDVDPAFSPDGRRIAFRSERDGGGLFLMDVTGESVRRLSNSCHNPAWSPDQASLACSTERIDVYTSRLGVSPLWIVDVGTGAARQLTTTDAVQPAWSPHGDRIAFWSFVPHAGTWTIPAGGGAAVRATEGPLRDWNPVWSPDGRHLFFASQRSGTTNNLWRVPIDEASGAVRGPIEAVTTPSSNAGFMSFSRDGSRMVYVDQSLTRNFSSVPFDRLTDAPRPVTRGAHIYRQLDVSPDGTQLAFAGDSRIFVIDVAGTSLRQLTSTGESRGPRWAPDGSRIAFYSNRDGLRKLWSVRPDGGDLELLTDFPDTKGLYFPVWTPNGHSISGTSMSGLTLTADLTVPLAERTPHVLPPMPMAGTSFVAWHWSDDASQLAGWRLLPDGKSAGITIYDTATQSYLNVTSFGTFPTWIQRGKALLFSTDDRLYAVTLASSAVSELPTPPGFASNYSLSLDQRVLYYAHEHREGNVWLISLPSATASAGR